MSDVEKLLSKGLAEGYAGGTKREIVQPGPFQLEASQYPSSKLKKLKHLRGGLA